MEKKIPKQSERKYDLFRDTFFIGFTEAVKSSIGIFKIMLPVSLLMTILNHIGIVGWLSVIFQPIASLFGLRGQSILALLSGYLINTYSAIALMISLKLPMKEISLLSAMILLSHTLPVELTIQKKAGGKTWLLFLIRVGSSIAAGIVLNFLIPSGTEMAVSGMDLELSIGAVSFIEVIKSWVVENVAIIVKIFIINIAINVALKFLIRFHVIDKLSNVLKPIMFIMGLAKESAPYWFVANFIGLIYGSGILISANENNTLDKEEISRLNISICSMHSIIQETANFMVLGVGLGVLIVPRFITAVISVWGYRLAKLILRGN